MPDREAVLRGTRAAHARLLDAYADWGGHNFYGWTVQEDSQNFLGKTIWSEADCVFRFGVELEKEFPGQVHFELNLGKATRADYDPQKDKQQNVDIVVSNLDAFEEDETSMDRFRAKTHEAFIEAKWLKKGWWNQSWQRDAFKQVEGITRDAARLQDNLDRGRCLVAACLIFDDECFFEYHGGDPDWPPEVELLLVSPAELGRQGHQSHAITAAVEKAEALAMGPKTSERIRRFVWEEKTDGPG